MILDRMARCTEDLTLDFAPADMLCSFKSRSTGKMSACKLHFKGRIGRRRKGKEREGGKGGVIDELLFKHFRSSK